MKTTGVGDFELRLAGPADARLLFGWVNRPDSLRGKILTTKPIAWPEHERWFAARLADRDTFLYVIERRGEACGQVRLEKCDDRAYEVDIYVIAEARRQGLAAGALARAIEGLCVARPNATIRAHIVQGNTASRHLFRRLGFQPAARDETGLTLEWRATEAGGTP